MIGYNNVSFKICLRPHDIGDIIERADSSVERAR